MPMIPLALAVLALTHVMIGAPIAQDAGSSVANPAPAQSSGDEGGHPESPQADPALTEPSNADDAPAQTPAVQVEIPVVKDAPLPEHAERALGLIEKSAHGLTAFTATLTYNKEDALLGSNELRTGELLLVQDDQGRKSFAILFDSLIVNGRRSERLQHYIFDGRWLVEVNHADKQFIKREIVEPGERIDPLKLGEGPFPLPIGQTRADVLARFDVTGPQPTPPTSGILSKVDLSKAAAIRLTPKPGTTEAKQFTRIDLFLDEQTGLPTGIVAVETNEDVKTIRLGNLQRNPELSEADRKKIDVREPDPKEWRIDVQPWGG